MPIGNDWVAQAKENPRLVTYQLTISLSRDCVVRIGRLGQFTFPAGFYVYTGSARRHLVARITRHLSHNKKHHWHIDYLLAEDVATVMAVHLSVRPECEKSQEVEGRILVSGFGASDCQSECSSHLKYLGKNE